MFELRSSDALTLDTAARVLAVEQCGSSQPVARSWSIEPLARGASAREWRLTGLSATDSLIPANVPTRDAAVHRIEHDMLEYLIRAETDSPAVHAALLSKDGRGVVIVGPSFAGKSTLATALWRSGWSLMADDVVFLDPAACAASPAPRRVSLRFESRELIGDELWNDIAATPSCIRTWKGLYFHPHEVAGSDRIRETPLTAIFFLARREVMTPSAQARAINPAKAALALVPYAMNIRTRPLMESVAMLSPIVASAKVFDLGRGPLDSMVSAVERCVA